MTPKFTIKKATKKSARLRLALVGPSGSGKTWKALALASALASGKRVVVIDTERASASKYADAFDFDALELETFEPRTYVEAIRACEEAGADVIVIDSLSHAWMGKGGALEQVDRAAKSQGGNSFGAWRNVTPQHNDLVDAILRANAHVIVTMRAKTEYVQEKDDRGRTTVRKVGLAAVQRDGMEYEFDVVCDVTAEHDAIVTKTRCSPLTDKIFPPHETPVLGAALRAWLTDGAAMPDALTLPHDGGLGPADAAERVNHFEDAVTLIANASSLADLRDAWVAVCRDHNPHLSDREKATLTSEKDARKSTLAAAPPAPPPDDEPPTTPRGPRRARKDDAPADATGSTADAANDAQGAPAAWLASEPATRDHALTLTTEWAVQGSARKHGRTLAATPWGVRIYAERLQAMGVGSEAQCLRYVAAWCAAGPVVRTTAAQTKRVAA